MGMVGDTKYKILNWENLKHKIDVLKADGQCIFFTNGCFDILHFGHITYLEKIKNQKGVLIVALNSDVSVQNIKGNTRPIIREQGRARLVAALECVDFVTIFSEETPYELIKFLQPNVLIKGSDWQGKGIVGEDIVKNNGGCVRFVDYEEGFSTSNIIEKILKTG